MASASVEIPEDSTTISTINYSASTLLTDISGGYDYELLGSDTDSRYECPICLLYLRDPVLTTCGHRFCERCISKWVIKEGGKCPVDGVVLEYENIFPDNFTRREILQCKAKCPFGKEGCSVILSLSDLEKHIQTTHMGEGNNNSVKTNGSPASTSSNGMVECYYKEVGCVSYFPQENLQRHLELDMHHHLQLLTAAYRRLKLSRPPDLFLRQDSRDSTRWLLSDESMDSDEYQFRRQRSWDSVRFARQAYIRPRYHERLAESDESLPKSGKGSSEQQLHHKSHSSLKAVTSEENSSTTPSANGNSAQVKDIFERLVRLEQSDREKQIKIDRLESQLSSALKLSSTVTRAMDDLTARYCQGIYVWKIQGCRKLCHEMRKNPTQIQTSPGFYTGVFEYKLCLRFSLKVPGFELGGAVGGVPVDFPPLDKDDETFVSLNIHFMKGEFDDTLRWPFNGVIKLQIIHPNPEKSIFETMKAKPEAAAFAKPVEAKNIHGFGYSDFCPISKIFSQGFVKDDTIVCKIYVKPI